MDWRAVRPVYMAALKQQGAAIELILTGKTVVAGCKEQDVFIL